MNIILTGFLLVLSLVTFGWGFERYRSRFVKTDLLIGTVFGTGLLFIAFMPSIYDYLGSLFSIQNRYVAISMFALVGLLLVVLYLSTLLWETRSRLNELTRRLSIEQAPRTDGGTEIIQVVIPAYNEEESIESVVRELPDSVYDYHVRPLVVSDGSVDGTARRAEANGTLVVEHLINQGQGGALQTGFEIAKQNNAEIVVTMDGDGQHPPDELKRLIRPIVEDKADFVMGSRYLGDDGSGNGPVRRAGIWTFTKIINILTKSNITDCTNGFRAIRGSRIGDLRLTEERFSAPELIIEARKHGLRVKELPITVQERNAGESKKPQIRYALGLSRAIITAWFR